jgi:uncharacterized membrane protein
VSELVAVAYPDVASAEQAASNVVDAQKARLVELEDLVAVERRDDGTVKLHQPSGAAMGALGGAAWGGLIGLLFLAPLVGMAIGAATGGATGALSDIGIDNDFMQQLGARLHRGGGALVLLVREADHERLLVGLKIPGEIIQTSLSDESEQQLRDALASAGAA